MKNDEFAHISGGSGIPLLIGADGRINVNLMRPFIDDEGQARIVTNAEGDSLVVNNGLLQFQEWLDIDRTVIQAMELRLSGITDLRAAGLVHNLGSIGQTVTMWQTVSEMSEANVSMDGVAAGEEDTIQFGTAQVPVPIIHKDWRLNMRRLQASRMFGESLDVTAASVAGSLVAQASERMLFGGAPIRVDASTIYGYRTFPAREQVDLTADWLTATPTEIKADVQTMLARLRANRFYGPFTLYIPGDWEGVLDEFFVLEGSDGSDGIAVPGRTIRDVLLSLSGLNSIKVADMLNGENEAVMVALDRRTVDLAIAQDVTTISWQAMGGMQERFKTMAVWVPRLKADFRGRSGIAHLRTNP